ncbi:hypothetical protein CRENBAI_017789 [Crenichthys baileyi]|uniref:Uncharacterized protein n=1 Tax=Crenichthys baileyi TaxID=28760 RepID=A0AAV9SPJ7_9TELE
MQTLPRGAAKLSLTQKSLIMRWTDTRVCDLDDRGRLPCRGNDDDGDDDDGGGGKFVTFPCPLSAGRLDGHDSGFAQFVRPHYSVKRNELVLLRFAWTRD